MVNLTMNLGKCPGKWERGNCLLVSSCITSGYKKIVLDADVVLDRFWAQNPILFYTEFVVGSSTHMVGMLSRKFLGLFGVVF